MFDQCGDFVIKEFMVAGNRAAIMMIDNMVDKVTLTEGVMNPLTTAQATRYSLNTDEEKFVWIRDCVLSAIDEREVFTVEDCIKYLTAGFCIFLFDGVNKGLTIGLQGFAFRGIEEPTEEQVLRGSREGFVEPLHINMQLVRRRLRNPNLKFVLKTVGKESRTDICVSYIKGVVEDSVLSEVLRRLDSIDMSMILASGNIEMFLQDSPYSIFSTVGNTVRPDTFCAKLDEGKIGLIVDGTPVALYLPFLFVENFQNIDDYAVHFYYGSFTRILKYIAFIISVILPALYVAITGFHISLLPTPLLHTLAQSEENLPFNSLFEAFLMQVIYELLREGGLRLPKQFGFAITIVGALIVGEATVSAGIIGAPMVIIVALTVTTSLVVPTLYEASVVLRFAYLLIAGLSGMYSLTLAVALTLIHLCSLKSCDVPYMAPFSPFDLYSMRDVVFRAPWKILSRKKITVTDMPGTNVDKNQPF